MIVGVIPNDHTIGLKSKTIAFIKLPGGATSCNHQPTPNKRRGKLATKSGTDAEQLVKDAALRLLEEEARFRGAVREGIAQANRGELIEEEEEMDGRFERCCVPN